MKSKDSLSQIQAVILAGGKGTRLAPYTTILPKPLMPISDMPVLEIILRQLKKAGIHRVTLSVGYLASLLEAYFGDGKMLDLSLRYSRESAPLGTAGPLKLIKNLRNTFFLMNGDVLTNLDLQAMLEFHRRHQAAATVGLFEKKVQINLGIIKTDAAERLIQYIEKPTLRYEVSVGIYVMEPKVIDYIPARKRFDLPELITALIADGQNVVGYRFKGYWLDIGRQEEYIKAVELFEKKRGYFLTRERKR